MSSGDLIFTTGSMMVVSLVQCHGAGKFVSTMSCDKFVDGKLIRGS